MKLEDLRRDLRNDRAGSWMCPRCGGYGKPLGATKGELIMASHCEGCDVVFGWKRSHIPIPPPSNEIELGDKITALSDSGQTVTGIVIEIEVVRDITPGDAPGGVVFVDRGSRNERALLQLCDDGLREWVGLRGAFVTEKSSIRI